MSYLPFVDPAISSTSGSPFLSIWLLFVTVMCVLIVGYVIIDVYVMAVVIVNKPSSSSFTNPIFM